MNFIDELYGLLLPIKSLCISLTLGIFLLVILDTIIKYNIYKKQSNSYRQKYRYRWRRSRTTRRVVTKMSEYYVAFATLIIFDYSLFLVFNIRYDVLVFCSVSLLMFAEIDSILQNFFEGHGQKYAFRNLLRVFRLDRFLNLDALPTKLDKLDQQDSVEEIEDL